MSTLLCTSITERLHPDLSEGRGAVREWLMAGNDPNAQEAGIPSWALAMGRGFPEAAEELLQAGADPNLRDPDGRGWLHWCVATGQPNWLFLAGLRQLDAHWWTPDAQGNTAFHLLRLEPSLAQAIGMRWWTEQRRWGLLCSQVDPVTHAETHGHALLGRIWRLWRHRSRG